MKTYMSTAALVAATLMSLAPPSVYALDKAPVLSLEAARKMVVGCEVKAKKMGWKMNIAVVDSGANLIVFERMNGAFLGSGDIARRKAETSAKFPFPSRLVEELSYGKERKGDAALPGFALVPGLVAFAGGLPIMVGGIQIGGIGVSGGSADEDELCAKAGLDNAKDMLQ
jgi:glc operon protein GlcG